MAKGEKLGQFACSLGRNGLYGPCAEAALAELGHRKAGLGESMFSSGKRIDIDPSIVRCSPPVPLFVILLRVPLDALAFLRRPRTTPSAAALLPALLIERLNGEIDRTGSRSDRHPEEIGGGVTKPGATAGGVLVACF